MKSQYAWGRSHGFALSLALYFVGPHAGENTGLPWYACKGVAVVAFILAIFIELVKHDDPV